MSKFLGKPKEYTIGENKITLKPLPMECIDIVLDMGDEDKRQVATKQIIRETLSRSGYEITDFDLSCFTEITLAVIDINGLAKNNEKS